MFISSMTEWPLAWARIASPTRIFLSITSSLSAIRWRSKFTLPVSSRHQGGGLGNLLGIPSESVLGGKTPFIVPSLPIRYTYASSEARQKRTIHVHRSPACKQLILRDFHLIYSRWQIGKMAYSRNYRSSKKFITKKDGTGLTLPHQLHV